MAIDNQKKNPKYPGKINFDDISQPNPVADFFISTLQEKDYFASEPMQKP